MRQESWREWKFQFNSASATHKVMLLCVATFPSEFVLLTIQLWQGHYVYEEHFGQIMRTKIYLNSLADIHEVSWFMKNLIHSTMAHWIRLLKYFSKFIQMHLFIVIPSRTISYYRDSGFILCFMMFLFIFHSERCHISRFAQIIVQLASFKYQAKCILKCALLHCCTLKIFPLSLMILIIILVLRARYNMILAILFISDAPDPFKTQRGLLFSMDLLNVFEWKLGGKSKYHERWRMKNEDKRTCLVGYF